MEKTAWFPAQIKPVHEGVYQVKRIKRNGCEMSAAGFAHWNGLRWGWSEITAQHAAEALGHQLAVQNKSWRGLAQKPGSST